MSSIHLLPEDLINKIAAGEVVERPASVVKELVENSIDANASQITVEIQGSGQKLIRISDNGKGMTLEECELSLQRHSTSKISELDDLFNITTLGFRGEALPSIASVSHLKIEPNPSGSGITVIIKDLFYNTPARKKFMKSPATELGHITNIINKYTLAYPEISFKLIIDGKPMLSSSGSGKLKDAVIAVYGTELAKILIENDFQFQQGKVYGLISPPTISRLDKNYQTFFVNKRFVQNFLLNRALEDAYRTLIPNTRHPIAILFIDIDPKQVDVNVHPSKREVKFVKTNEIMQAIRDCVAKSLHQTPSHPATQSSSYPATEPSWQPEMALDFFPETSVEIELEVTAVQPLIPLYQLKNTYIIATDGESLVLIDQHAAHERIIYDELQISDVSAKGGKLQTLLIPETIEVNSKEKLILDENLEYLKNIGFDLEEFGSNSYILRSVPAQATKITAKELLQDIICELEELGRTAQLEIRQENIRKTIACKAAIKAGDNMSAQEMNHLIRDLYQTENPSTCPHGRPTMIKISENELIKRFGR